MHLINTRTLELKEFISNTEVSYAILSHVWVQGEEVAFKDFRKQRNRQLSGYHKIKQFCELAARDGHAWAWVDSCCIDKRSSAELSEAINSMFTWYHDSMMCYAHLSDFSLEQAWEAGRMPDSDEKRMELVSKEVDSIDCQLLVASKYFTRGWTLQEMLAPRKLTFVDCKWRAFGTRASLARPIEAVTGISDTFLMMPRSFRYASFAERMSWSVSRKTTRTEDVAYCLLGLVDVHLPLLYGEGVKAFDRFYQELCRSTRWSDDFSIFLWNPDDRLRTAPTLDTVPPDLNMPHSPAEFLTGRNYLTLNQSRFTQSDLYKDELRALFVCLIDKTRYTITNNGIEIKGFVCDPKEMQRLGLGGELESVPVSYDFEDKILLLPCYLRGIDEFNSQKNKYGVRYIVDPMISGLLVRPQRSEWVVDDGVVSVNRKGPVINVSSKVMAFLLAMDKLTRQTILFSERKYAESLSYG